MKVSRSLDQFHSQRPVVLTQGTFDGIHIGHQKILKRIVEKAKSIHGESVLLTFYPHPRLVLYPDDNELKLITTLHERIELLKEMGIDQVVVLPFTKELSRINSMEYVRDILVNQLKVHTFVIGYDHRFGRNREGSIEDLLNFSSVFDFQLEEIPRQDIEESTISSSKIRRALLQGDVKLANAYLGRDFSLRGVVQRGRAVGKELGFPTANIYISDSFKIIPQNGVYAVRVKVKGEMFNGMLNIGDNPTFSDAKWSIEVNIFAFNEDIYEQQLEIFFVERMRDEVKFENIEELREQLERDRVSASSLLTI
jgi:riboflavin kinase/FMN adenylyltransferase